MEDKIDSMASNIGILLTIQKTLHDSVVQLQQEVQDLNDIQSKQQQQQQQQQQTILISPSNNTTIASSPVAATTIFINDGNKNNDISTGLQQMDQPARTRATLWQLNERNKNTESL
jgi:type II secretory pathway pseudopilin PulG